MPAVQRPTRLTQLSLTLCCVTLLACGSSVVVDDPVADDPIVPIVPRLPPSSGEGASEPGLGGGGFNPVGPGGSGGEGGCGVAIHLDLTMDKTPTDIIVVVDNSGSMAQEIGSIAQHLNVNFAQLLQASGLDYQVIMLARHGHGTYNVCVQPPLSGTTNCSFPPVNVPGQFYHYSLDIQSHDSLCSVLDSLDGTLADEYNFAPGGWQTWLRPEAHKAFVVLSDDGVECYSHNLMLYDDDSVAQGQQMALDFDNVLLSSAPSQFGTPSMRNYSFYSLVGMASKAPGQSYDEFEPVVTSECGSAIGPGTGYQWLSRGTGALRFPVCDTPSIDGMMQQVVADLVDGSSHPCLYQLPEPPQGQYYDFNRINLNYAPGDSGPTQSLTRVDHVSQCMPRGYLIDEQTLQITLCPQTCDAVKADGGADLYFDVCPGWY